MNHNPDKKFSADENCGLTHKQIEQMWGSPENIDAVSNFTRKLKKLDLSFEEIALLRGVVVLSRGKRDNSNISIMNSSVTSINNIFMQEYYSFMFKNNKGNQKSITTSILMIRCRSS